MTLAIVANSLNAPSETFIRAHVRDIAPGRTVVLCDDGSGAENLAVPVLSEIRSAGTPRHFGDRFTHFLNLILRPFLDPSLRGLGERRVRNFLKLHRVTVVLAEFGQNGSRMRLACKREQIPLYVHFHGSDATKLARKSRWRRHYRQLFRDATGIIVPSGFLADRLRKLGCPDDKLYVSPHGIGSTPHDQGVRFGAASVPRLHFGHRRRRPASRHVRGGDKALGDRRKCSYSRCAISGIRKELAQTRSAVRATFSYGT